MFLYCLLSLVLSQVTAMEPPSESSPKGAAEETAPAVRPKREGDTAAPRRPRRKKKDNVVGYLQRAPYIQNVTREALSILWETPVYERCVIKLTDLTTKKEQVTHTGPSKHHAVRFTELKPQHRYRYRLESIQGVWSEEVETAPFTTTPFNFLVFGDNRNGHEAHASVIKAMTLEPASFFINTGDLTKDGADIPSYIRFFRLESPLMKRIPLYPVVGNHENAVVAPGLTHFRRYFDLPTDGPEKEMTYSFTWGNSRFFFLDTNRPFVGARQSTWFRTQLQATALDPTIRHTFVFVHQSPYTSGPHGPHKEMHDAGIVDDMRRFGVNMVFAAHDHIYERGRVDGLNYVVTGGGGAPIYFARTHRAHSIVVEPTYHYCRLFIKGDRMEFSAHRIDGSQIDFFTLKKTGGKSSSPFEVVSEHRTPPGGTRSPGVVSQRQVTPPATAAPVQENEEDPGQTAERGTWLPYFVGGLGFLMLLGLFVHARLWGVHRAR